MSPRDTRTGGVLEAMILPSLARGGYSCESQVVVGTRLGGRGRHFIDAVAEKNGKKFLISLKWQQTSGTAEQKVPFEVMCLMDAIEAHHYAKAYLVLGGAEWSLRDFYVSGGLKRFLKYDDKVEIMTLESFVAKANRGELGDR